MIVTRKPNKTTQKIYVLQNDPRFSYSNEVQFKSMEEFLNVKDVIFEENEKLLTYFNFLKEDCLNYDGSGQLKNNIRSKPCKLFMDYY
jgi:hypothetical protein